MHRVTSTLTSAAALLTLTAGCTGPVERNSLPDLTDEVQRAYAMAQQRQLQVAAITQEHWSRLEEGTGNLAKRVEEASAPGNRFFAQVLREDARRNPPAPNFRAGMTDNCSYFPIGSEPNPGHTTAVARICLDHNGHIFGTWRRATNL